MAKKDSKWADALWVMAISAQGGLMVALPVLIGLALGYWLDSQFGTLPWITLLLVLTGGAIGPVILYRWVVSVVKRREERRKENAS